jgi:hypothetical protein
VLWSSIGSPDTSESSLERFYLFVVLSVVTGCLGLPKGFLFVLLSLALSLVRVREEGTKGSYRFLSRLVWLGLYQLSSWWALSHSLFSLCPVDDGLYEYTM